ncbi:MAG: hypothetical protein ABEK84_05490 [Salinibacter sp.]
MIGRAEVDSGTEITFDSIEVHFVGERTPHVVECVTDITTSRDFRTNEETLQILHKSCGEEEGQPEALVIKPLEIPVAEIESLVLRVGEERTTVTPEELLE